MFRLGTNTTTLFRASLALFFCSQAFAEGFVTGRVTDTDGVPVAGASIRFIDEDDPQGVFADTTALDGSYSVLLSLPTPVEGGAVPGGFQLFPNYPNPFNSSILIPLQPGRTGACRAGSLQPARAPGSHPGGLAPARRNAHGGLGRPRRQWQLGLRGGVPVPPAVRRPDGRRKDDPDRRRLGEGGQGPGGASQRK